MPTKRSVRVQLTGHPAAVLSRMADPAIAQARATVDPTLQGEVVELVTLLCDEQLGQGREAIAGVRYGTRVQIPRTWMPARVASVAPVLPCVTRIEDWRMDGQAALAEVALMIVGVPGRGTAHASLTPSWQGHTCLLTYVLELTVGVPIVGQLIEGIVVSRIAATLERECDVLGRA